MTDKINDGGTAFPQSVQPDFQYAEPGMSLRDWFAGHALAGIIGGCTIENAAELAYKTADAMLARRAPVDDEAARASFQPRVGEWMLTCFDAEISADKMERNHRFVEEALELAQACECTASEAHQLVDYVFGRPEGWREQEVGGVMVTLAALCNAWDIDMSVAGETELTRIWGKIAEIRTKQASKPKHSPLPGALAKERGKIDD